MKIELIMIMLMLTCAAYAQEEKIDEAAVVDLKIAAIAVVDGKEQLAVDKIECVKTNSFTVKGKAVTDFSSSRAETWRFIHDGSSLIVEPFFTGSTTYSPFKIVECKTFDIATNEIARLKLKVSDQQNESICNTAPIKTDVKDIK